MCEPTTHCPILTLTIQVTDLESESIDIFCLTEIDAKIEYFCKIYKISDKTTVKLLTARIRDCLQEKYPFLVCRDSAKAKSKRVSKTKPTNIRDALIARKIVSKQMAIETSVSKVGIQSLLYSRKGQSKAGAGVSTTKGRGSRMIKSFAEPAKSRVFIKGKNGEDKENFEDKEAKERMTAKPMLNIDLTLSGIIGRETTIASVYNSPNPLLSYSYTNPSVIYQRQAPQTATNKSFVCRVAESELDTDNKRLTSNFSQSKLSKKSSFYEHNNDRRCSRIGDNQVKLKEIMVNRSTADTETETPYNYENYVYRLLPKNQLRSIFESLDGSGSGLVGPKNLNLRSLSAEHLKMLEGVVIEIFRMEQNGFLTFNDFCRLVKDHVRVE